MTKLGGNWSEKSKMAAYTREMRISQLPDKLATRFQRLHLCFGVCHTNGTCIYIVRLNLEETGSGKSQMAAYTHEMRIFQLDPSSAADAPDSPPNICPPKIIRISM